MQQTTVNNTADTCTVWRRKAWCPNYLCLCVCVNSCNLSVGYPVKLHPYEKIHTYDSPKIESVEALGLPHHGAHVWVLFVTSKVC